MKLYLLKTNFGSKLLMHILCLSFLMLGVSIRTYPQKPKSGTYTYNISFAERQGRSPGISCTVVIKGDSIKVLHNGNTRLPGKKGDVLDQGIIIKHAKTGKWIIGRSLKDRHLEIIGGCSGGPSEIDFKRKRYLSC